ncbi:MAG: hypothetical protein ACYDHA_04255, partial [Bellilinea sp.]
SFLTIIFTVSTVIFLAKNFLALGFCRSDRGAMIGVFTALPVQHRYPTFTIACQRWIEGYQRELLNGIICTPSIQPTKGCERLVPNTNFHGVYRDFPGEKFSSAVALGRRKSQ